MFGPNSLPVPCGTCVVVVVAVDGTPAQIANWVSVGPAVNASDLSPLWPGLQGLATEADDLLHGS